MFLLLHKVKRSIRSAAANIKLFWSAFLNIRNVYGIVPATALEKTVFQAV